MATAGRALHLIIHPDVVVAERALASNVRFISRVSRTNVPDVEQTREVRFRVER